MPLEQPHRKPHIYLGQTGKAEPYTSPSTGRRPRPDIPPRNRQEHGSNLFNHLYRVQEQQDTLLQEAGTYELTSGLGIQIEFESFPGIEMAVESLADARQQIELQNVIHRDGTTTATVFVPEGKLSAIETKLVAYMEHKVDRAGHARDRRTLIDAIQAFRAATLQALWNDDSDLLPEDPEVSFWWEVWLPVRGDRQAVLHDFRLLADVAEIRVSDHVLEFPERTILLAYASRRKFSNNTLLLNTISELRKAKETAAFFDELPPAEQHGWAEDLKSRLVVPEDPSSSPVACILDTGANIGHPLLEPFINQDDQFTLEDDWTGADDEGHGTGMAGLAAWGDLTHQLDSMGNVEIGHRLESVKILRHPNDSEDKLRGIVTVEGVSLPEIRHPQRTRIFAMAVTATDSRDRGRPSAWSSALDSLAVDYLGHNQMPRLMLVSAGNAESDLRDLADYPTYNEVHGIHDPGQAWNVLTVGACTEKDVVAEFENGRIAPLAPTGGLSPFSTTSVTWHKNAPVKPEVVFEGGNVVREEYGCTWTPSLSLLTTHHKPGERLFTTFRATSAATALAARFAAQIQLQYPEFWPETVRALMVHSAEWTDEMLRQFATGTNERQQAQHRVRCVGFGVPNLVRALWSANNSLALIVEDRLQPFEKRDGRIVTRDMHLHDLPWPRQSLEDLGEVEVEMTVTLSYFIEPNPSSCVVSGKYSYQSHGLRFDVRRSLESETDFRSRINRQARDEEEGSTTVAISDPDWLFGPRFRNKGSVHKDIWRGKAVELAERNQIAVYPAMGWWRTRTALERYEKDARYSLVVTIAAPEVEVDLYNEIVAQVVTV